MRDFKGMKRQRGRNRNGGGAGVSGGGGKPQQNVNRAFDSNGPDNVKIRGHAQHVFEKYQQLARDAFSSGDRVLAENYLQHADHYFRVLRMLQPQRPAAEILGRDVFTSGLDIDFEDEGEGFEDSGDAGPEPQEAISNGFNGSDSREIRSDRDRSDRDRQDRYDNRSDRRDDRFEGRGDAPRTQSFEPRRETEGNRDVRRDNRRFEGRPERAPREGQAREGQARDGQPREGQSRDFQPRDNQGRDFQGRDSQTRGEGQSRENRDDRPARGDDRRYGARGDGERAVSEAPRDQAPRDQAPRDQAPRDQAPREQDRRDPLAVIEPDNAPLTPVAVVEPEASPMLRSQDGGMSEAPAFLQSTVSLDESGEVRRPRTRRRRPKALDEGDDGATPAPAVEEV
jgi:hypothetical protein